MSTLLAEYRNRRAAHGRHVCQYCFRLIAAGEHYIDQRCVQDGSAYTFRAHKDCDSAYWAWKRYDDPDDYYPLVDVTDGHLPPCPRSWPDRHGPCSCRVQR